MATGALNADSGAALSELHLLLTYRCNFSCSHCFVWGGPSQTGTMTMAGVERILDEAQALGSIRRIYFEGGEPFIYYALLLAGVRMARERGFEVGIVSNAYWATSERDALEWLRPLANDVVDLSVSSDVYHGGPGADRPAIARRVAERLGIPAGTIAVAAPGEDSANQSPVRYRGRAAQLVDRVPTSDWDTFTTCPWEDLHAPGRVHVDSFGYLHICQGISIGNLFERPLREIMQAFDPQTHPIVAPLLAGGPAELVRRYSLAHKDGYADHCHLCFAARGALRERFPEQLAPDQMYGPA
jgi:organic radical activating enzyme